MARFALALVVFATFTVYSLGVVYAEGYLAFLAVPLAGGWSTQITLDLGIALVLATFWMVPDAKKHGVSPWPFVAALPALGSVAMLAYLVAREWKRVRTPALASA